MASTRITFTLPEEMKAALERVASKTRILEADIIRMGLERVLKEYGEDVNAQMPHGRSRAKSEGGDSER